MDTQQPITESLPFEAPKLYASIFTTYTGWDEAGDECLQVYGAVLAKDITPFKAGDKIDTLFINTLESVLELYVEGAVHTYNIVPSYSFNFVSTET